MRFLIIGWYIEGYMLFSHAIHTLAARQFESEGTHRSNTINFYAYTTTNTCSLTSWIDLAYPTPRLSAILRHRKTLAQSVFLYYVLNREPRNRHVSVRSWLINQLSYHHYMARGV